MPYLINGNNRVKTTGVNPSDMLTEAMRLAQKTGLKTSLADDRGRKVMTILPNPMFEETH
ncbi:hypothetical protein [Bifidobacterium sp. SO1]|uniref:hypothetical protein n=1 Tax=Bifidobacterium sp. SO1 TaxID=2809029 RepID=UPI001BDC9456|nr:hypothetical protein [Bifidobacterium sp. SO1]MBT1161767.1 hypothetical protein [Bifidobacterium sp. SO1]